MRTPILALALTALLAPAARASQKFPGAIENNLQLNYRPACSLCHIKGNTGPGTAFTPFALSMRARGLTGGSSQQMIAALTQLGLDKVDSDGDGVTDIAELIAGTDPNVAGGQGFAERVDPAYGCTTGAGAAGAVLPLALLLLRRRRRTRRP